MDELEIVKTMRAHALNTGSGKINDEAGKVEAGWLELDVQDNIAQVAKDGYRTRPLTQLAMAGIQGLGIQRAFWNSETRELVAVIWVGPRLSGWPGIAHGGAIATIFEEIMSRMIAGPSVSIGMH
jgi:acyl-coenzyme A thioesterase PaaI-like protein